MAAEPFQEFRYRKSEDAWVALVSLEEFVPLKSKRGQTSKKKIPPSQFEITVPARVGDEPSTPQAKAFKHLLENESAIFEKVAAQILASFITYVGHVSWIKERHKSIKTTEALFQSGLVGLLDTEIMREHKKKSSYIVFHLFTDWEVEHGMYIVYTPATKKAKWGTSDDLCDLTESDEEVGDLEIKSEWEQLVDAISFGEKRKIKQLIAAGVDINKVPKGQTPPLYEAVSNMNTANIRDFLKHGADPNAGVGTRTAYKTALKIRNDYGFAGATRPANSLMRMMTDNMKKTKGVYEKLEREWNEVIRLMEEAGGKE
ncbi:MAG: DUF6985 domain-containing protein [Fimbriiglobus sp.]